MITSFPSKKAYNPGGYSAFEFIPYYDVLAYPMVTGGKIRIPIELLQGKTWLKGYSTYETLNFQEEAKHSEHGTYYTQTVSGFIPGDKTELITMLQSMEQVRFLVMLRDNRGVKRLVGSPVMALEFQASFASGSARSDAKGFSFQFTGESIFRAPEYEAV